MNKKRIGVITFHNYDNYGAILQSYALQKKLRELGTYPEIRKKDYSTISTVPSDISAISRAAANVISSVNT